LIVANAEMADRVAGLILAVTSIRKACVDNAGLHHDGTGPSGRRLRDAGRSANGTILLLPASAIPVADHRQANGNVIAFVGEQFFQTPSRLAVTAKATYQTFQATTD
jgi:hypothetical protein